MTRVPDQNGVSQAQHIVEIYHSGLEHSMSRPGSIPGLPTAILAETLLTRPQRWYDLCGSKGGGGGGGGGVLVA